MATETFHGLVDRTAGHIRTFVHYTILYGVVIGIVLWRVSKYGLILVILICTYLDSISSVPMASCATVTLTETDQQNPFQQQPLTRRVGLPPEIILLVLESLYYEDDWAGECGDCAAVCLGLTCRSYYAMFKSIFPEPINLGCFYGTSDPSKGFNRDQILANLIRPLFGPQYRLAKIAGRYCFLAIDVYGIEPGLEQIKLNERWDDWTRYSRFPSPVSVRGAKWYIEAGKVVDRIDYLHARDLCSRETRRLVYGSHFYRRRLEQREADALSDWDTLLGI